MTEIVKVNYDNADRPTILGRELHEALEVKTAYKDWIKRMIGYGFAENTDFVAIAQKKSDSSGQ